MRRLAFRGEGWPTLRMATWNTRSLTFERLQYCKSLNYDVLAITELWRNQSKYQTRSKSLIVSEQKILTTGRRKGQPRYPDDKDAGVVILLSQTAAKKIKSFGSEGERVCWVRLKGPTCNIFVIAVYLPHRGRVSPCQADTMRDRGCPGESAEERLCVHNGRSERTNSRQRQRQVRQMGWGTPLNQCR